MRPDPNIITYTDIELAICNYYGIRQHIIVPNVFIGFGTISDHECDLLVIKKSGYAVEIEIKMSVSDLKADFKKVHKHENEKLQALYYAVPNDLYEKCKDLFPKYAGIYSIYKIEGRSFARIERSASNKKCRKLTIEEQLKFARLGVMRIWNLKTKYCT